MKGPRGLIRIDMLKFCLDFFLGTTATETFEAFETFETRRTILTCQCWTGKGRPRVVFSALRLFQLFFEELAYWLHGGKEPGMRGVERGKRLGDSQYHKIPSDDQHQCESRTKRRTEWNRVSAKVKERED